MHVVIVGAGVIGLMQARELAQQGVQVTLIDKGDAGREASWAGGGIISPLYPWRYVPEVTALATWSQQHYEDLINSISHESGIDPEYSPNGLLILNVVDREQAISWSNTHTAWLEELSETAIYDLEPELQRGFDSGLWMPKVASIRNPRLLRALKAIAREHSNITVIDQSEVVGIDDSISNSPVNVSLKAQNTLIKCDKIKCDKVVVCSGAWSQQLLSKVVPEHAIDVRPVKGQMILFQAPRGLVNRVVLSDGKYVIPRKDGSVLAGSTLEENGFDKTTSEEAKQALFAMATKLFPALRDCPVTHHWAGLRPGSPGGVPYIGALPGHERIYINAGHFRNGLVLAPASVRMMTTMLCDQTPPLELYPYRADRHL